MIWQLENCPSSSDLEQRGLLAVSGVKSSGYLSDPFATRRIESLSLSYYDFVERVKRR